MVIIPAKLHSTKHDLKFCTGSNPASGVLEIRDGENLWQWFRLFPRSTIPQKKQFIIIIIIVSHRRCCIKKAVLKNFEIFTGKHLCWSFQSFRPATLSKTDFKKQVFSREYCEIFKSTYFEKHLPKAAPELECIELGSVKSWTHKADVIHPRWAFFTLFVKCKRKGLSGKDPYVILSPSSFLYLMLSDRKHSLCTAITNLRVK